jgi:hypothetical protein
MHQKHKQRGLGCITITIQDRIATIATLILQQLVLSAVLVFDKKRFSIYTFIMTPFTIIATEELNHSSLLKLSICKTVLTFQ